MHSFCLFLHYLFYKYMFPDDMLRPYTLVWPKYARGFSTPQYGVRSPNTLTSAAPRTYSIICIGSESCLGSIVGFARLPSFSDFRGAYPIRGLFLFIFLFRRRQTYRRQPLPTGKFVLPPPAELPFCFFRRQNL